MRNVEKRFVQRERLDEFGIVVEDVADLLRNGLVDIEARRHEDQVGTETPGQHRGDRRTDSERPGLVTGRRHDTPRSVVAHGDRTPPEFGTVTLLDGGVESIHIDVYDLVLHTCKNTKIMQSKTEVRLLVPASRRVLPIGSFRFPSARKSLRN